MINQIINLLAYTPFYLIGFLPELIVSMGFLTIVSICFKKNKNLAIQYQFFRKITLILCRLHLLTLLSPEFCIWKNKIFPKSYYLQRHYPFDCSTSQKEFSLIFFFLIELMDLSAIMIKGIDITIRRYIYTICHLLLIINIIFNNQLSIYLIIISYVFDNMRDIAFLLRTKKKFISIIYQIKSIFLPIAVTLFIFQNTTMPDITEFISVAFIVAVSLYDAMIRF